jgi:hypothetical protein
MQIVLAGSSEVETKINLELPGMGRGLGGGCRTWDMLHCHFYGDKGEL